MNRHTDYVSMRILSFAQALGFITPQHLDIQATGNMDVALEAAGNGTIGTADHSSVMVVAVGTVSLWLCKGRVCQSTQLRRIHRAPGHEQVPRTASETSVLSQLLQNHIQYVSIR